MSRLLSAALVLLPAVAQAAPPTVTAVAYHPAGSAVVFARDPVIQTLDAKTGNASEAMAVFGRVTALAFDPHAKYLAIASTEAGKSGLLSLIAVQPDGRLSGGPNGQIAAHKDAIYALAFSPDGKTLATAGYDRVIHLWEVPASGERRKEAKQGPRMTLRDHSDAVYGLAFHPDGKLLASVSADRAVKVWEVSTGKRLYTLSDPTEWVYAVAWSPDKK